MTYFYIVAPFHNGESTPVGISKAEGKVCYVNSKENALQLHRRDDAEDFKSLTEQSGLPKYDGMTGEFEIRGVEI